jgi:hypothetical protein
MEPTYFNDSKRKLRFFQCLRGEQISIEESTASQDFKGEPISTQESKGETIAFQ